MQKLNETASVRVQDLRRLSFAGPGEVHVWSFSLDSPAPLVSALKGLLSVDERERAGRFRFATDAGRFIVAHGRLRQILGSYTGVSPRDIRFKLSSFGKPEVSTLVEGRELKFNLSHSGSRAIVAVAEKTDIGVDIEEISHSPDVHALARRCFSRGEIEFLQASPPEKCTDVFFTIWTRKEAYVKALGEGMSHPLQEFDLSSAPKLLDGRWMVRDLPDGDGFRSALAVRAGSVRVRSFALRRDWIPEAALPEDIDQQSEQPG